MENVIAKLIKFLPDFYLQKKNTRISAAMHNVITSYTIGFAGPVRSLNFLNLTISKTLCVRYRDLFATNCDVLLWHSNDPRRVILTWQTYRQDTDTVLSRISGQTFQQLAQYH